jgi:endogenous inhibitor of DNA gyrase (YacG/DUF329 family)
MPRKRIRSLRCPTCKKIVLRNDPEFPFCSDRCRLIDLGKWASGGYVISTPITDPEEAGLNYTPDDRTRDANGSAHKSDDDDSRSRRR